MSTKYLTEKPTEGRYYHLPDATTVIDPDGGEMLVEPGRWPTEEDERLHVGSELFFVLDEWIPKGDAEKGIYIGESDYDARMQELDRIARKEHPEWYEDEDDDGDM